MQELSNGPKVDTAETELFEASWKSKDERPAVLSISIFPAVWRGMGWWKNVLEHLTPILGGSALTPSAALTLTSRRPAAARPLAGSLAEEKAGGLQCWRLALSCSNRIFDSID